jgi:hypothetical protein
LADKRLHVPGKPAQWPGSQLPYWRLYQYDDSWTAARRECLVVYSDGLIDVLNLKGEELCEELLVSYCRLLPNRASAESICTFLSQRVAEWSEEAAPFDGPIDLDTLQNGIWFTKSGSNLKLHSITQHHDQTIVGPLP